MSNFLPFFDGLGGGSGPTPLPLDMVPGAAFGYSTRRLRAAANAAASVRRASDGQNIGIGFVGNNFDDAAADAYLAATTGSLMAWADQSGAGAAVQLTVANQPAFVKTSGAYGGLWTAHGPQLVSAPGGPAINDFFTAGGYVLAVIEMGAPEAGQPAGILTKGSWGIYLYQGGGDPGPSLWLQQNGVSAPADFGTGLLPAVTGRHIVEVEYNSASPSNVPIFRLDGGNLALVSSSGYTGGLVADTGPLEIGNISIFGGGLSYAGRILEVIGYKGIPAAGDRASLRDSARAAWGTP